MIHLAMTHHLGSNSNKPHDSPIVAAKWLVLVMQDVLQGFDVLPSQVVHWAVPVPEITQNRLFHCFTKFIKLHSLLY